VGGQWVKATTTEDVIGRVSSPASFDFRLGYLQHQNLSSRPRIIMRGSSTLLTHRHKILVLHADPVSRQNRPASKCPTLLW